MLGKRLSDVRSDWPSVPDCSATQGPIPTRRGRSNAGSWIAQRRAPLAFASGWIEIHLTAGLGWQVQLEKVISEEATAFAVHVGAKGVVNWVENEVRLGLSGGPLARRTIRSSRSCPENAPGPRRCRPLYDSITPCTIPSTMQRSLRSFCALCCTDRLARGRSRWIVRLSVSKR